MNKIALVTGAAQGIGLAVARRLALDGTTVLLCDVQVDAAEARADELRIQGFDARAHELDTSDEAAVQQLAEWVHRDVGTVEILVNNAGISGLVDGAAPLTYCSSLEQWNRVLGVNLTGVFLMCRAFAPGMIALGRGRIINIASAAGRTFVPYAPAAYSASKAALVPLTWKLADELGPHSITVNCIAPGRIDTPMGATVIRKDDNLPRIPLRRAGTPDEIAGAVAHLASDEASYTTGTVIDVHGGLYM